MKPLQIRFTRRLRSFQGKPIVVRVWRLGMKRDYLSGFVLGVQGELLLLAILSDKIKLDGYSIVRLSDITRVKSFARPSRLFYRRVLPRRDSPPRCPHWIKLTSMEAALRSVNLHATLLTIHPERRSRTICYIGQIIRGNSERFLLDEIDADALWNRKSWFRIGDVTRLDWDGGYEKALWRAGGKRRRSKG